MKIDYDLFNLKQEKHFDSAKEAVSDALTVIGGLDLNNTVIVLFTKYTGVSTPEKDVYSGFYVGQDFGEIINSVKMFMCEEDGDIPMFVSQFNDYEDAFEFCKLIKE